MKVFDSKYENLGYLFYRVISPVFDPIRFVRGLYGYTWFLRDYLKFKGMKGSESLSVMNIYPALHDKSVRTSLDAHYFYQQLWVFEEVMKSRPKEHVDVGSTYQMSGYLSKITKATFVDIRPLEVDLKNLTSIPGDVTSLPFESDSINSLSCLHVLEHIGLGRYGDQVNPVGWKIACKELSRILSVNGILYLSVPVGRSRVCFNAHRVFSPNAILKEFSKLSLRDFSLVDDYGRYITNVSPKDYGNINYGCGMFTFTKG
ncbi:DUF268 domain-containing protein [candidate division WWE3 bacterium]|uniref:DUF268 domain-containing protein n=1 Tax=candidate division WWE3 bacterium TaxID=2053526 RepID=A0A7X9E6V1_UNCKA|nr:DUF268 domain-containing protein [candidate division WWE3 bacterium]